RSATVPAYHRQTRQIDALIASAYLVGTNTRRVKRALVALFGRGAGKDVVSRTWRKLQSDWEGWNKRTLEDEPILRLILDGTIVRVRLDNKATSISLLVALGVRRDDQKGRGTQHGRGERSRLASPVGRSSRAWTCYAATLDHR